MTEIERSQGAYTPSSSYQLGFARYETFTAKNGCPRCGGALFAGMCLMCGYDGPTRPGGLAEPRGRPVVLPRRVTHKHGGVAYRSLRGRSVRRG